MNVVIYHGNCSDGFCSAWIANKFLIDTEYIPMNYGEPVPWDRLEGKIVYMVDFSFKKPVILELINRVQKLTILDHHKTAEEELSGLHAANLKIMFDMTKSGCRLTWDYFTRIKKMERPWLVDYVEDRDLWKWALPNSKEINTLIGIYDHTFQEWDQLEKSIWNGFDQLVAQGSILIKYKDQLIKRIIKNAYPVEIAGHKVEQVNSPLFQSEIGEQLAMKNLFGVCYFDRADGKRQFSLRSRNDFDVSEIAKRFGGGGHPRAAGYEQ